MNPQLNTTRRDNAQFDFPPTLAAQYARVRAQTERLAQPLSAEDCALQSMPDASPVKWHLAHTTWFFETFVLERALPGYREYSPQFRVLFNSYYVAVGPRHPRPERGMLSRPSLDEVRAYRRHVDTHMAQLLAGAELPRELLELIELGTHHEQQHQELIVTDLKHLLSRNPLQPAYVALSATASAGAASAPLTWIGHPDGIRQIGHAGDGFRFDNEEPRHRVFIDAYAIASRPVTVGEYAHFIADGGYRRPNLWLSEGWDVRNAQGWTAPLYWQSDAAPSAAFTLHGVQSLDPAEPVCHLSFFEADAYARWAGARLPTEAEWETFAATQAVAGNFLEDGRFHPAPAHTAGDAGAAQVYGDVWEWTRSAYEPYPGYRAAPGAVGEYNGKFMSNQYVLRGGSCATPASHIRAAYRNFFPAAARWQFSGVRLARDGG
jgi:ergothioneine biosynthesis protein EgtB